MSYIIEKKQGNQIYLYKVESYWDKEKVEEKEQKVVYEAKDYGQIYLMKNLAKEICNGLEGNGSQVNKASEQV